MGWQVRWAAAAAAAAIAAAGPAARAQEELSLDLGGAPLVLRKVPKGSFQQGSPPGEPGREADEAQRQVTLSWDVYFGKHPVTRGQFARFVADTGYRTEAETGTSGGSGWNGSGLVQKPEFNWKNPGFAQTDEHPVVLVTFADAQAFIGWASKETGRPLRLPTEAELEHATRAGTTTAWYGGATEERALQVGWFKAGSPGGGTHPVGQRRPNAFGLHDMVGSVYQWCADYYAPYPPGPATDPVALTPPGGSEPARRVLRGGSWLKDPARGRSAARYRNTPGSRNADNGFRVVADVSGRPSPLPVEAPRGSTPSQGGPGGLQGGRSGLQSGGAADAVEGGFGASGAVIGGVAAVVGGVAALGGLGALVYAVTRVARRGPGRPVSVTAQPAQDGFWLRAEGAPAGARVRYACRVGPRQREGWVKLSSAPQTFEYTGGTPTEIRILQVTREGGSPLPLAGAVGQGGASSMGSSPSDDTSWAYYAGQGSSTTSTTSSSSSDEPFRGYPSAY